MEAVPVRAEMIDGEGQAGEASFASRMPGLYATAYDLHFALKRRGVDRRAGLLEGLYWTADGSNDLGAILGPDRGTWRLTLLIALPDEATDEEIGTSLARGRVRIGVALAGTSASRPSTRAPSSRFSTVGRTRPSARRSSCSTRRSPRPASGRAAATTSRTLATHAVPRPIACGPCCGNRSDRPDIVAKRARVPLRSAPPSATMCLRPAARRRET